MPNVLLPRPMTSQTAISGKIDARRDFVYSAAAIQHGAGASVKVFTVAQGGAIPTFKASGTTATANAWQTTYTLLTTNLNQQAQLGNTIGDANVHGVGLTFEPVAYTASSGAPRAFGATQFEVADILEKTFFIFRLGGKVQVQGPAWSFPAYGGEVGSISTTGNATTTAVVNNGVPGRGRKLGMPLLISRTDTIEGEHGVAGSATLAFSVTSTDGQPLLCWYALDCTLGQDVR